MSIVHYYSSTSEEHTPSLVQAEKATREEVMNSEDCDDEVAITKEVHNNAARTLKQMALAAKCHPGLRSTS